MVQQPTTAAGTRPAFVAVDRGSLPRRARTVAYNARIAARRTLVQLDRRLAPPPRHGLKVNLGGGNWHRRGWLNVDFYADPAFVDHRVDFRAGEPLPFGAASVATAFCSHVLEHLRDDEVVPLLADVARVLQPGGTLRIAVPDIEAAAAAARRGDDEFFRSGGVTCRGESTIDLLANFLASFRAGDRAGGPDVDARDLEPLLAPGRELELARRMIDALPPDADYYGHVNAYDVGRLTALLREAGFVHVWRSGYRASRVPELRQPGFDVRPQVSLFVEAIR
jgi:SAM-dependent methyltransferase